MRLFGMIAPDEQDVGPVVVVFLRDQIVRRQIEVREVGNDREHARRIEPERFELLAIELGIAQREIDAGRVDAELAATLEALFDELLVHVDEELGRRDVVVHENLAIRQRVRDARCARPDREVMNQDVRRVALLDEVAVVARLIFEAGIGRLNENVRLEPRAAKHALDAEHFVPDGIAVAEGGEHLVDFLRCQFSTGPNGSSASTSLAGRRTLRRFASQPGSGSIPRRDTPLASSSFNRARMSRYFCSMTGHA